MHHLCSSPATSFVSLVRTPSWITQQHTSLPQDSLTQATACILDLDSLSLSLPHGALHWTVWAGSLNAACWDVVGGFPWISITCSTINLEKKGGWPGKRSMVVVGMGYSYVLQAGLEEYVHIDIDLRRDIIVIASHANGSIDQICCIESRGTSAGQGSCLLENVSSSTHLSSQERECVFCWYLGVYLCACMLHPAAC